MKHPDQKAVALRIDQMYRDLINLEAECEELGWRSVGDDVYGARLRLADARETVRGWGLLTEAEVKR